MSNSMPHCKWYGRDWLGDPLLRMVGPAEKGVWADLLNAMMCSEQYGYLTVKGKPMVDEDAARICGTTVEDYRRLLARLEEVGIPSRTAEGVLFSRRLVRDYEAYRVASRAGKKGGGNPLLAGAKKPPPEPPPSGKNPEPRSQKPEATVPLQQSDKPPSKGAYKGKPNLPDEAWMQEKQGSYAWLDVKKEAIKAQNWCEVHGRIFTRKTFVNWLNRCDKPLGASATTPLCITANTPLMVRIGAWYGRPAEELWTMEEAALLARLGDPPPGLDILEKMYKARLPPKADFRRQAVLTLLKTWHAELDRARGWEEEARRRRGGI